MAAIHQPARLDAQVALEPQQGVHRRHDAAREEMPAQPIVGTLGFERVHQAAVREQVHEQLAARAQPRADARQQVLVVAHVLEHFHRHAAVECRRRQFQRVDVAGDDLDVQQPSRAALRLDVLALRRGIRDRRNARRGIAFGHPQRQGSPAATQFQNALAVHQFGAQAGQFQHGGFGLVQRFAARGVIAAGVLQLPAQAQLEEVGRQLVVLGVGGVGVDGDGAGTQLIDQLLVAPRLARGAVHLFLPQTLGAQAADAVAHQRVGHQAALGQAQ
ncbi:hypothetical protein D3C87_1383720 [compost metagenome]